MFMKIKFKSGNILLFFVWLRSYSRKLKSYLSRPIIDTAHLQPIIFISAYFLSKNIDTNHPFIDFYKIF